MMKHYTRFSLLAVMGGLLFASSMSLSAETVSREEFKALQERVEQLEATLRLTRNTQIESIAAEAVASMPVNDKADRESLVEDVVRVIQQREESANYPWMDADKWSKIRKGMSPEAVIAVLGDPTLDEPSLHKRKDRVFTWQGRRVATAKKVEGIIRFYKGGVIEIEPPVLK